MKWTAVPIPPTATDLAQYATKASGTEAKTVLLVGGGPTIQQMVNASSQIGFKPHWIIPSQRPDIWESLGANAEGLIYFDDQTYAYDDSDEDAALFRAVMEKYEPDAPYTAYATMAFSNLLTLQRLGEQAGGDQITAENLPKLLGAIKLDQFMGPELDASKALPQLPHAVRTGAYLYTHKADGDEPAGKGYYEVPQ